MMIDLHAKIDLNIYKPLGKSVENYLIAEIYNVQGP